MPREQGRNCSFCRRAALSGKLCSHCGTPEVREGSLLQLVEPVSWEPPPSEDPQDLLLSTDAAAAESGTRVCLHSQLPFDEDTRREFKEANYLRSLPPCRGRGEQPQDWWLAPKSPWRSQVRFEHPLRKARRRQVPPPHAATYESLLRKLMQTEGKGRGGWTTAHGLLRAFAPSYPDGFDLAWEVPTLFVEHLVTYTCAFLNAGDGGELYMGVEDREGRVMGVALSARQRRTLLYVAARALQTVHPPLPKGAVRLEFIPVCSDPALSLPVKGCCVIRLTAHLRSEKHKPRLFLHPYFKGMPPMWCSLWTPMAPVRRLGSLKRLGIDGARGMRAHLAHFGISEDSYAPFLEAAAASAPYYDDPHHHHYQHHYHHHHYHHHQYHPQHHQQHQQHQQQQRNDSQKGKEQQQLEKKVEGGPQANTEAPSRKRRRSR
eukprot:Hpha_TRINITY_DN15800_c6_g6::TRINITY_DN15800_c6_g6_i1::g.187012::m.187012